MKYKFGDKEIYIFFEHERKIDGAGNINNRGGKTIAYVENKNGTITKGEAKCRNNEVYNKKLGRIIATGKLLKQLGIPTKYALTV